MRKLFYEDGMEIKESNLKTIREKKVLL